MNSKEYWKKREAEQHKHHITEEAEYDKEIERIYKSMLDSVQNEINAFYGKYARQEDITIAEAKKRVSALDIKAYERKAKRIVKDRDFSKEANEEMRLYNLTMKVNRLEMLKANIGLELISGHDELQKFMDEILQGRTMDELERQAGILGKTIKNNAKAAHAIVNASFHNATFSDRIWQYQDLMRADLGKLLQTALIQGKNPRAVASELRKYWYGKDPRTGGGATYCMQRLMRTELARVQIEAQKQSFVANGFEMYTFHALGDCCDICKPLNGKHFKIKDMQPALNAPPMHPHCRCSTSAYEDSDEYEAWIDYLAKGGTTEEWNKSAKTRTEEQKKTGTDIVKDNKADLILRQEEVINIAKKYGDEILSNLDLLEYDNGYCISNYVNKKLGYDKKPQVLSASEFEKQSKGKTILYRGLEGNDNLTAQEMAQAFKNGKFYCGRGVYGNGTYTDKEKRVAEHYAGNNGTVLEMFLADNSKTVSFKTIYQEYEKTGIPRIVGEPEEAYQDILRDVGTYAAIKGYDGITLDGFQNKNHVLILNRGKVIVKE